MQSLQNFTVSQKGVIKSGVTLPNFRLSKIAVKRTQTNFQVVRAAAVEDDSSSAKAEEFKEIALEKFTEYKGYVVTAWNDSENKPLLVLLGLASVVGLYSINSILNSVDQIPLLGDAMKIVGMGATVWFATKYFKSDDERAKINTEIDTIKIKVLGK
eukprot:TRINITY_DN21278_c0_g1_i1.p2 TRINITY_DN21278_c0_g1~~TRINITY_DN21278_c0_g1_i1.p2  ORF type:complete len:157 (+),score=26.39 TRINITY_DN21278_c0_g1_i1:154-624(+)